MFALDYSSNGGAMGSFNDMTSLIFWRIKLVRVEE